MLAWARSMEAISRIAVVSILTARLFLAALYPFLSVHNKLLQYSLSLIALPNGSDSPPSHFECVCNAASPFTSCVSIVGLQSCANSAHKNLLFLPLVSLLAQTCSEAVSCRPRSPRTLLLG